MKEEGSKRKKKSREEEMRQTTNHYRHFEKCWPRTRSNNVLIQRDGRMHKKNMVTEEIL